MKRNKWNPVFSFRPVRLLLAGVVCMLAACSADVPAPDTQRAEKLDLNLRLQAPEPMTVSTRTNPTLKGIEIKNVRVLQFGETNNANKYYDGTTDADWCKLNAAGNLAEIATGETDFYNENSNLYIIVNDDANNTPLTSTTLTESGLQSTALSLTGFSDTGVEPGVLVYGPVSITQNDGTAKPVAMVARLKRAYAKVGVKYEVVNTHLTLTSVEVQNVPPFIYPFASGTTPRTETYLTYTLGSTDDPSASSLPTEFTFFMPPNLRGNGTATTEEDKNRTECGPKETVSGASVNCLDHSTCIVLKGTYLYPDATASISVEYRFYLGTDMVQNYDVKPGYHYRLTLKLLGANSADARVDITDSNVFTILDPDEVEHKDDIIF